MKDKQDRVALVTGASGGIGTAVCAALADGGFKLVLHYSSNISRARAVAAKLGRERCALVKADLSKPGAAKPVIDACLRAFGRLDLLVNNAGAVLGDRDFMDVAESDWERTFRLNAFSPFFLSREAFRAMKGRGGRIVNISSIAAKFGGSARSMHYGAAKAAVEAMTVSLARLGAPEGILVNAVRPGVIDTDFHVKFRKNMKKRIEMIPLKRMGTATEVAAMVAFLAGPGGDYATGQVFSVTGGE
jgi:3-oxoacyl-[acyl-carrier protein] reductase